MIARGDDLTRGPDGDGRCRAGDLWNQEHPALAACVGRAHAPAARDGLGIGEARDRRAVQPDMNRSGAGASSGHLGALGQGEVARHGREDDGTREIRRARVPDLRDDDPVHEAAPVHELSGDVPTASFAEERVGAVIGAVERHAVRDARGRQGLEHRVVGVQRTLRSACRHRRPAHAQDVTGCSVEEEPVGPGAHVAHLAERRPRGPRAEVDGPVAVDEVLLADHGCRLLEQRGRRTGEQEREQGAGGEHGSSLCERRPPRIESPEPHLTAAHRGARIHESFTLEERRALASEPPPAACNGCEDRASIRARSTLR